LVCTIQEKGVNQEAEILSQTFHKNRKKPEWVKQEVIKIKAYGPQLSCRLIAEVLTDDMEIIVREQNPLVKAG
jgi:hypothetical protein